MAFAQNLEKCFHILTQEQTYSEEELCIKLEDALLLCNKFSLVNREIVILHNPEQIPVKFQLQKNWLSDSEEGSSKTCFLSDMLYVIYSPRLMQCRIFLMKNRMKKATEFVNRFYTGLAQLDLLSSHSSFTLKDEEDSGILKNEEDSGILKTEECGILKEAEVFSVSNYGIFHKVDGFYDMKIYSADLISPLQEVGVEPRRVVVYRGSVDQRRVSGPNWIEDYESLSSLRNFGKAVEDMMIGQPVSQHWKDLFIRNLSGMDEMDIPGDFQDMSIADTPGIYDGDSGFGFLKSVGSIVLINIDEE